MKKIFIILILSGASLISSSAWAGLFTSCDSDLNEPEPDWVSKPDYSLPGYYVGVGSAENDGMSKEQQSKAAENSAKSNLVQRIEVTIRARNEQSTRVSSHGVEKDEASKVTVSAEEVLRDLKIKSRWVDKETCAQYILMVISKEAVAQAKREKTMKNRVEEFKALLVKGADRDKNPDINLRRKYLEDAQALLLDTDFSLLPGEIRKEAFANRLDEAFGLLNKEALQTKGHTALFAINPDTSIHPEVIGEMLDKLRSGDNSADCNTVDECISRAKERGFSKLALLVASSQVSAGQMGALKGTLTVSRTVYDIESRKILKGPDTVSAQVIGWSNDELDWNVAAGKAMQDLK